MLWHTQTEIYIQPAAVAQFNRWMKDDIYCRERVLIRDHCFLPNKYGSALIRSFRLKSAVLKSSFSKVTPTFISFVVKLVNSSSDDDAGCSSFDGRR